MSLRFSARLLLSGLLFVGVAVPADAQQAARTSSPTVRVTGAVRDDSNAITLPGIPVEVVGANQTVYTDVDGRYTLELAPGTYQLKVSMEGYQERMVTLDVTGASRNMTTDIGLTMSKFAESVTVTADAPLNVV